MKLLTAYNLFSAFTSIAALANKEPSKFSIQFKLAIAENRRVLQPHATEFEELHNGLIKQYGEEFDQDGAAPDAPKAKNHRVLPTSPNKAKFDKDSKKLCEQKVAPRLRFIYEADLGDAPLTVEHLSILQECEVLKSK